VSQGVGHGGAILTGVLVAVVMLSGCAPRTPSVTVAFGDVLLEEGFDESFAWEQYISADGLVNFGVGDGVYNVWAQNGGFSWGLNATAHTDVILQVDTQQYTDEPDNAYGIMCRAAPSNNGDGYYFMISGDGGATIRIGTQDTVRALVAWERTSAVNQGRGINRIRAACIGDYLALWVNGQFVMEVRDDTFQRGFAGITGAIPEGKVMQVAFDDFTIWEGLLSEEN